ncbi:MAG: SDR family NAD(P)-dependent oxidoreductase [Pseudomonadota bacterium]
MYALNGRKALITGAAQGTGFTIAERLAHEGCDVALRDLDGEASAAAGRIADSTGKRTFAASGDVSDPHSVDNVIGALTDQLGGLDILVNNAGVVKLAKLEETAMADFRKTFGVNVEGMMQCIQRSLPALRVRTHGRIVSIASWMGKQGVENYGAYCASKAAIISLTQTLALEVAKDGITVNAVCPGLIVNTRMHEESDAERKQRGMPLAHERAHTIPLGRVGYPADIAKVAAFRASDEADYMTGQASNITGGLWMN